MFNKKNIKKFGALFLTVVMAFSMVACTAPETNEPNVEVSSLDSFNPAIIHEYNGEPWVYVNNNEPFFTEEEITNESFESYSELDELGRAGTAFACLSTDTQPADGEKRGNISSVSPSGWEIDGKKNNVRYDCIEGGHLYNRCHLIMWALSGENANERNLITGTRYMNIDGMLDWEDEAMDYVDSTGNHLMYRVTPVYTKDNLVADGVLMEAYSVEDNGEGLKFCVYAYNVQPGVEINYETGESWYSGVFFDFDSPTVKYDPTGNIEKGDESTSYVLNTNSKKIHTEDCELGASMSKRNRKEFTGSIDNLLNEGYTKCKTCLGE